MGVIEAMILGLVQGLTEFLPVSSSAHIRIVGELLGTGHDPGAAFTAIIQLGTETAVIVYFWRDIMRIVKAWCGSLFGRVPKWDADARLGWFILLGTVPIVVLGFLFQTHIETTLRSLWFVAATSIVFGILLGVADAVGAKKRRITELSIPHAITFGLAQALALIPGVSRSGGTITAGLFLGYERGAAARYSFLLAIPAVLGTGIYQLVKTFTSSCSAMDVTCAPEVFGPLETATATVVAFVVALFVIAFFMAYITRHSFIPFVIYRIALGGTIITLLVTGILEP